jgi:uncharacterized membrane protein
MTILLTLVAGLVISGLVALVVLTADPWLTASQTLVVPGRSAAQLDAPVRSLLASIWHSELTQSAPGVFVLVVRRSPTGIWLLVLLTLPFGLLLLLIKQSEALQVLLTDHRSGTEVRIVGRTKKSVITTLAKALGSLQAVVNVR